LPHSFHRDVERVRAAIAAALEPAGLERGLAAGRALSGDEAIAEALRSLPL
jgi:hypothetical protein